MEGEEEEEESDVEELDLHLRGKKTGGAAEKPPVCLFPRQQTHFLFLPADADVLPEETGPSPSLVPLGPVVSWSGWDWAGKRAPSG